ncbi:MAG TPA: Maf family protein [Herpetosiphonaceae bacterium]|jgi:septum formation protein|nr:Maf family protein [Herpetosiphonaceae bacterium]
MPHQEEPALVLASASPRRRELLRYLGVSFEAVATTGEEQQSAVPDQIIEALPPFPLDLLQHPTLLAWRKVNAAAEEGYRPVLLGADTIVVIDGEILNKPRDAADARRMLARLAGRTHTVYTGVVALDVRDHRPPLMDLVRSDVTMAAVTRQEIADYVASGEPLDKAGAYGIQGLGGRLVQRVEGSYTAVVGLPLVTVHRLLRDMEIPHLVEPADAFRQWLTDQGKEVPAWTIP